ncbi:MAG: site-specific integrase, partial [Spirochaetes bacterium]|nr:site-specific integrase [Spirochaetota bacterium]
MKTTEKNLKLKDGEWLVDISVMQPGGKLKRFRGAFPTKTEAQNCLALIRSQKAMRRLGIDIPDTKRGEVFFKDFAEKVIVRQGELRPRTKKAQRKYLNAILGSELFKGKRLGEITTEDIAHHHANRGIDKKPSANAELGFLNMVFRRAVEWGELTRNPAAPVKRFRLPLTKLRILTDDEAELLLNASSSRLVPVLRALLTTGMRPHEVFALHWEHDGWDTEKGLAKSIVAIGKKTIFIPGLLAKNHKDREVPLGSDLLKMFRELHGAAVSGKVFPWNSCPREFMAAVKAAKLKNVSLYTLKHTAASCMIKDGVDIVTVSELLGHSDIKMTMRYCHSDGQSKR